MSGLRPWPPGYRSMAGQLPAGSRSAPQPRLTPTAGSRSPPRTIRRTAGCSLSRSPPAPSIRALSSLPLLLSSRRHCVKRKCRRHWGPRRPHQCRLSRQSLLEPLWNPSRPAWRRPGRHSCSRSPLYSGRPCRPPRQSTNSPTDPSSTSCRSLPRCRWPARHSRQSFPSQRPEPIRRWPRSPWSWKPRCSTRRSPTSQRRSRAH